MLHPIKFHDFSTDKTKNYSGFGLKSIKKISGKDEILKMSLEMGLISNVLVENFDKSEPQENLDEDDQLLQAIMDHTESLSKRVFPHELQKVHQNRLY